MEETKKTIPAQAVKRVSEGAFGQILNRINELRELGQLKVPRDYSPENAVKAAWLILEETLDKNGKPVLETCTFASVCQSILKMVIMGLNPLKSQGSFIARGEKLNFDVEYAGNILLAKRFGKLNSIKSNVVFEGDEFDFLVDPETGRKKILKHVQKLASLGSGAILGAYAITELTDGTRDLEVMDFRQIQASWNQGAMKGNSPAHKNFPDQMAMKTVINRACKLLLRSSSDENLLDEEEEDEINVQGIINNNIKSQKEKRPIIQFEEEKENEFIKSEEKTMDLKYNDIQSSEEKEEIKGRGY